MWGWRRLSLALLAAVLLSPAALNAAGDAKKGAYIYHLAGCADCHTDVKNKGQPLAGGRAMKTPFGTFYTPNITSDKKTGIGNWNEAQFVAALKQGLAPDGSPYFPSFPYPSYTKMTAADAADLWAYLKTVPAVDSSNKEHDLNWPFSWRFLVWFWRWLFFEDGPDPPAPEKDQPWQRGRYLVNALSHCGECHTPRNFLGGVKQDMYLAGWTEGPGGLVPNITPDSDTGIGGWSADDLGTLLSMGMLPDGDFAGGEMAEVVENTGKLSADDLSAMVAYLRNIKPIQNRIGRN